MTGWRYFCKIYRRKWELEQVKKKMDIAFQARHGDGVEGMKKGMQVKRELQHAQ